MYRCASAIRKYYKCFIIFSIFPLFAIGVISYALWESEYQHSFKKGSCDVVRDNNNHTFVLFKHKHERRYYYPFQIDAKRVNIHNESSVLCYANIGKRPSHNITQTTMITNHSQNITMPGNDGNNFACCVNDISIKKQFANQKLFGLILQVLLYTFIGVSVIIALITPCRFKRTIRPNHRAQVPMVVLNLQDT